MTDYRYQLESRKLTGRNPRKIACPECHKKKCFVRYVDTHNNYCYLSDEVGKCDHQHSCGCYDKWRKVMQQTQGLDYNISDELEQYPANTDLADLLLEPP